MRTRRKMLVSTQAATKTESRATQKTRAKPRASRNFVSSAEAVSTVSTSIVVVFQSTYVEINPIEPTQPQEQRRVDGA